MKKKGNLRIVKGKLRFIRKRMSRAEKKKFTHIRIKLKGIQQKKIKALGPRPKR